MESIIWLIVGAVVGIAAGFVINKFVAKSTAQRAADEAHTVVEDAKRQAETLRREAVVEAKDEALRLRQEAQAENKERLKEVRAAEQRVNQREESLDRRVESLDTREKSLDSREHQISSMQGQLDRRQHDLDESEEQIGIRLQQVAGMTADEAKTELLDTLKDEVAHQSAAIIRDSEARTKAEADKKARSILSLAIQRVAADHTAETTVSAIHIPSDDLKGRIIGREGRNIRSFEQLTRTSSSTTRRSASPSPASIRCVAKSVA